MRVIAGKFRSCTLKALEGRETRPTYDRLKETLFNVLFASGKVQDCIWADLFAGTGAIGIEAASRGAQSIYFAENNPKALRVLRQNLAALNLSEAGVAERDAAEALRQWEQMGIQFDVCFLDPPYALHGAYAEALRTLARGKLLRTDAVVVAEHEKRFDPGEQVETLRRYRLLKQGDSALSFYRREDHGAADDAAQGSTQS
ncbi:MAG: 16S rRNA (guanine(966)-N(2))-methyltransferase RsmD [Acidobacteriota bacterium]|nr:16S rRNA (guanine(966)-N(2))-methyltransferase RsmD [Acidobacteriota bacterium]